MGVYKNILSITFIFTLYFTHFCKVTDLHSSSNSVNIHCGVKAEITRSDKQIDLKREAEWA